MAHKVELFQLPFVAASAIGQYVAVSGLIAGSAISETVRAASVNDDILGVSLATAASPGDPITVAVGGVIKMAAAASLGAFARLKVASVNGGVIPAALSGTASAVTFSVGKALKNAAAGDLFPVLIQPEQVV